VGGDPPGGADGEAAAEVDGELDHEVRDQPDPEDAHREGEGVPPPGSREGFGGNEGRTGVRPSRVHIAPDQSTRDKNSSWEPMWCLAHPVASFRHLLLHKLHELEAGLFLATGRKKAAG